MADPTPIPAPAPAPAPAPSPAVAQRFADPDSMVRINVLGKEQTVPVKVAVAGFQTNEAGKLLIEQAKQMRTEMHLDREQAERFRSLEHLSKTNPEQALAGMERLFGVKFQQSATDFSDPAPRPAGDPETRALAEKVRLLESNQNQVQLRTQTREALDNFELFRNDPEAREAAEEQIYARMVIKAGTDPMDVAREVHDRELRRASRAATQQRDGRLANQDSLPNIPAALGVPGLSEIPQGTEADLANGNFGARVLAGMKAFGRQAAGQ